MAVPLKKDRVEEDRMEGENLTTADLAQGTRAADGPGPRPVASERTAVRETEQGSARAEDSTPLFPPNELEDLRRRWSDIQTAFVDEPRKAVEQADGLVASAMKRIAEVFAEERSKLEKQWDRGDDVSTEDLRVALQRYRTFFHRLLSI